MKTKRMRFAPSPTGYLHVGNARTALFNWLFARQQDGVFILRVEDTDVERSTAEYDRKLMEDLRWLGLDWDEGPDVGGEYGPYRQSQRLDFYKKHAEKLLKEEKAYHCFCSHNELEKERKKALDAGLTPVYNGKCCGIPKEESTQRIASGENAAIRLRTPDEGIISFHDLVRGTLQFDLSLIGDPILVRSNGIPAYNYAVVVDDFLMAITHVIRGEDHIQNTPRQILTCRALDFDPPVFAHLSMVMGKDNTRLSKRHGATAVDQFDKEGILPSALFNYLALLGWAPPDGHEVLTKEELVDLFRLEKVSRSSAIFDYDKLAWINRQHIKTLPSHTKAEYAFPHLNDAGLLPEKMSPGHWVWLEHAVEAFADKIDLFSQLPSFFSPLFEFSLSTMDDDAKEILKEHCSLAVIRSFSDKIERIENFDYEAFGLMAKEIKEDTGCKGKDLYHPLRVALTAKTSGLELNKFIPVVEEGAKLAFPKPIKSCAQRASETRAYLDL
ncbi:MAG TPA: glutamate--tRNA ligase [Candidatus Heimdallarchaeota archaeon]|nr:glutamate--tRNA ligase [Candidatus Heimdallarchaeota archaeon]